jgi:hypothetical protein
MRLRGTLDTLTAVILVVWLNVVGSLLLPRLAEADMAGYICGTYVYACAATGNGCTACTNNGTLGSCIASSAFNCIGAANLCANQRQCSCNPLACSGSQKQ